MPLTSKLDRTLRPAEDDTDNESYYEVSERSSPSVVDTGADVDPTGTDSDEVDHDVEDDDLSGESTDGRVQQQLSKVSFGALAKAQDALSKKQPASRKRKRGEDAVTSQEDKLQVLRQRLHEIKAQKLAHTGKEDKQSKGSAKSKRVPDEEEEDEGNDSESDSDAAPRKRSSKNAPAVQSSKRAVTRRRNVVEVKKRVARDPRFDSVVGRPLDDQTFKKRYGFLDDYRESEMAELRATIKKTKKEEDKEALKRRLRAMESQKKARQAKEKQQEIAREHRKKEKDLVKQGKQPFYLKKSEQKKLALIDRFQNMKAKERDKLIERRRKKATAKERRNMPAERRAG